jgi:hypothetical protein
MKNGFDTVEAVSSGLSNSARHLTQNLTPLPFGPLRAGERPNSLCRFLTMS